MKPSLGRIVLFRESINGQGTFEYPAIITKVYPEGTVNLQVFRDFDSPVVRIEIAQNEDVSPTSISCVAWRWPPRVD